MRSSISTVRSQSGPLTATAVPVVTGGGLTAAGRGRATVTIPGWGTTFGPSDWTATPIQSHASFSNDGLVCEYAGIWHVHAIVQLQAFVPGFLEVVPYTFKMQTFAFHDVGTMQRAPVDPDIPVATVHISMELEVANAGDVIALRISNLTDGAMDATVILGAHYIGPSLNTTSVTKWTGFADQSIFSGAIQGVSLAENVNPPSWAIHDDTTVQVPAGVYDIASSLSWVTISTDQIYYVVSWYDLDFINEGTVCAASGDGLAQPYDAGAELYGQVTLPNGGHLGITAGIENLNGFSAAVNGALTVYQLAAL